MSSRSSRNKEFIIYGRMSCPWTKMAVDHAKKTHGTKNYDFVEVSKISPTHNRQLARNNHSTIPAIFKKYGTGYRFMGGYTEFVNL